MCTLTHLDTPQASGHAADYFVGVFKPRVVPQVGPHNDRDHAQHVSKQQEDPVKGEPPASAVLTAAGNDNADW